MGDGYSWYYAFFGIHYLPFVIPAAVVLLARIVLGKVTKAELLVLGLVLLSLLAEALQLTLTNEQYKRGDEVLTVTWERYFGVLAPILWLWTAHGLVALWTVARRPLVRWGVRLVLVAALGWSVVSGIVYLVKEYRVGAGEDARVAAEAIAPVIKADYKGPARYENFAYQLHEYYTARRPVVVSFWGCAGWAVRGQSQGVAPGYPNREDYLFARVDSRYRRGLGRELELDPTLRFVREVQGTRFAWRLYRRVLPK